MLEMRPHLVGCAAAPLQEMVAPPFAHLWRSVPRGQNARVRIEQVGID